MDDPFMNSVQAEIAKLNALENKAAEASCVYADRVSRFEALPEIERFRAIQNASMDFAAEWQPIFTERDEQRTRVKMLVGYAEAAIVMTKAALGRG